MVMRFIRQITRPARYLLIIEDDAPLLSSKLFVEWVYPATLGAVTAIIYLLLPDKPRLIGPSGIFSAISDLFQLFAAFFLAALAAVASFDNPKLNEQPIGSKIFLYEWDNKADESKRKYLNRRSYISYMFGYLAWMTILFFIIISLFEAMKGVCVLAIPTPTLYYINSFLLFMGMSIFFNVIFITISGISYLTERLND
ncbi:hypothetical protein [Marinicauda salina]|uniref:hypothetical protein n=1 Tax=Marinicauda salina TaxID=2135793 RepID=UPI0011B20B22|nr:hypothetical protein [Marinicauda salina]